MQIDAYFVRFVEILAAERTKERPDLFDDCVQEGLIATWQAMEKNPGKPDTYYRAAARQGVGSVVRGRSPFGHAPMRGYRDATTAQEPISRPSRDGGEELVHEPSYEPSWGAIDIKDAVRHAVASLPEEQRIIAWGRYWEDRPFAEVASEIGRPVGTVSRIWTEIIRPKLAVKLADVA